MNTLKHKNMVNAYNGFLGPITKADIMRHIPDYLIGKLTGKELGLVMAAVNSAYHSGKRIAGADIIDGDAIWINKLGHIYELNDIATLKPSVA